MSAKDPFIDKTTTIKSAQPVEFVAEPFKGGYRVRVRVGFDPNNSIDLDQFMAKDNNFQMALDGFIKNTIEGTLGGKLLKD